MPGMILHGTPPRRWLRALCENGGLRVSGQVLRGPRRPERAGAGRPPTPGVTPSVACSTAARPIRTAATPEDLPFVWIGVP